MSAQTIADVFAPAEASYREDVRRATWGHLTPKKNKTYRGRVVYALGCFGSGELNPTVLHCDFGDLESSPWFYDALHEFLDSISWEPGQEFRPRKGHGDVGCVYEWTGTFRNYKFRGAVKEVFRSEPVASKEDLP